MKSSITGSVILLSLSWFLFHCESSISEGPPQYAAIAEEESRENNQFGHQYLIKPDSLFDLREYDSAIVHYRLAAKGFQEENNWEGYIRGLNGIASSHLRKERYRQAIQVLEEALAFGSLHLGEDHLQMTETHFNLGWYYQRQRDPDQALEFYQKSLAERLEQLGENHLWIANCHSGIGDVYLYTLGNPFAAEKHYQSALSIAERLDDKKGEIPFLVNYALASVYRRMDNLDKAELHALQAMNVLDGIPGDNSSRRSLVINALANIYNLKRDYQNAIKYYKDAIDMISDGESTNNTWLSLYYANLGTIYNAIGKSHPSKYTYFDTAQYFFRRALDRDLQTGTSSLYGYQNLGWNYIAKGNYDSADYFLKKSLAIALETFGSEGRTTSWIYENIGDMYLASGEHHNALNAFQKALIALIDNYREEEGWFELPLIDEKNYSNRIAFLVLKKANTFKQVYHASQDVRFLKSALDWYNFANQLSQIGRNSTIDESAKLEINQAFQADLEKGLECAFLLSKINPLEQRYLQSSFKLMESNKYLLLLRSLVQNQQRGEVGIPPGIVNQENILKTEMAFHQQQKQKILNRADYDDHELKRIQNQIFEISRKQENLIQTIQRDFPNYFQIKYDSLTLDLKKTQELIEEGEQIIEYYWGDSAVYILGINRDSFRMEKVTGSKDLKLYVDSLLTFLSRSPNVGSSHAFQQFQQVSNLLFKKLLEPFLNNQDLHYLIVVPDGPLSLLPFEILLQVGENLDKIDYKNLSYLMKDYQISYAYSAGVLANQKKSETRYASKLLAFGYTSEYGKVVNSKAHLPGTEKELSLIKKSISGDFFLGQNSSEKKFKDVAGNYDIIHLSIHGETALDNPLNNRLIFPEAGDTTEDGILYPYELYDLKLNSDLVVLSACETGIGRSYRGEGIYSMARAFVYAGCPSVIMSLWNADDRHTADIMGDFYKNLSKGADIARSIHQAKLEFLAESDEYQSHPYYWSSFIPLGDMTFIEIKEKRGLMPLIIMAGAFVLALLIIYRQRMRGRHQS